MKIIILTLTGKEIPIDVDQGYSVIETKEKIESVEGIPPDQQRLVFEGKQLEDDANLTDYGICEGSKIYVILRLRGC